MERTRDAKKYAATMQIQIVDDRGLKKVNMPGVFFCGILYTSDKPIFDIFSYEIDGILI